MDLIEIEVIDMAAALALTLGITQAVKMVLDRFVYGEAHKFAPLIAIVAAALSVAVLVDLSAATQQDVALAIILVAVLSVGSFSGVTNVAQGVRSAMSPTTKSDR